MVEITNTSQFSLFSLIRSAIIANSTLSIKFSNRNIHQFEPKHKSSNFTGFPYIWVNIPNSATDLLVFNHNITLKEFSIPLILRLEYVARKKLLGYINALISALEDYESTFEASGYYDVKCELEDVDSSQVIDQNEIVEGLFGITFRGQVSR